MVISIAEICGAIPYNVWEAHWEHWQISCLSRLKVYDSHPRSIEQKLASTNWIPPKSLGFLQEWSIPKKDFEGSPCWDQIDNATVPYHIHQEQSMDQN